jgi:hypothetical protein
MSLLLLSAYPAKLLLCSAALAALAWRSSIRGFKVLVQVEKTRLIPVDLFCLAIFHSRSSYFKRSDRLGGVKICSQKRDGRDVCRLLAWLMCAAIEVKMRKMTKTRKCASSSAV